MVEIIDASHGLGAVAGQLVGAGVNTVIRYYSRDTGNPAKRLSRQEAEQLSTAGLRIGIVHEAKHGDRVSAFSRELGALDAAYALEYGQGRIRQPSGSAIYFGVDFDVSAAQLTANIIPYFEAVGSVLRDGAGADVYGIGVYGSGRVCKGLQDAGLVDLTWLAQSTGWNGYTSYKQSNDWTMLQQMPTNVAEVDCDPDLPNPDGRAIGDFVLDSGPAPAGPAIPTLGTMRVIAGPGLRLRAGPGTEYDVIGILPNGAVVSALKIVGDWTLADTNADGAADGFLSSHYLVS